MGNKETYEKGKTYKDLGKYLGIQTVFPYGEDYTFTEHKFVEAPKNDDLQLRKVCKVNTIFIEKLDR